LRRARLATVQGLDDAGGNRSHFLGMQRALFALGIIIALVGLAWPWISKLPLGRLPGDFLIERPGFRLFLPFTTMLIISVLISLILMLFRK
jgi:Protein of unknown function (DUF2905)